MVGNRSAQFSLAIVFWISAAQSAICQSPSRSDQLQSVQACYPVDQIIDTLVKYMSRNKSTYPEPTLITAIKRRTVCSQPTVGELGKIRSAGGSDKLIDAIEAVAPPLPAPLPAPSPPCLQPEALTPKRGRLTVSCTWVDCNVLVNGTPIGITTNKVLSQTMPEGPIVVSVATKDYEPDRNQEVVDIKDNQPKLIHFELHPSRAALKETGATLFKQMIVALGGEDGMKASALVRGKGTLTLYRDGKTNAWEVLALIKLPDKGRFSVGVVRGRQNYQIVRTEGGMDLIKMGKGAELEDLNLALHQFQEYQLTETLRRLQSPSFRIVATELSPIRGEDVILKADGGSERYSIRLDSGLRPKEILLELGGLDKGTKVLYSDYTQTGPALYPKRMQVQRPDATSNGIDVRFDTVELNPPDVKDADFMVKKGKH